MNQTPILDLVNPATVMPISDIYMPARLKQAVELVRQPPENIAAGIVMKRANDTYVEVAGRYRNLAATFQTIDLAPNSRLIPVYVVTSLDQANSLYKKLLAQESGPLNRILEAMEDRWATLDKRVSNMKNKGYTSLVDVARQSTVLNYRPNKPINGNTKNRPVLEEALF